MTTVKRVTNLADYTAVLPYASEMFGVYQPLLGWKSKRIEQRFIDGYRHDRTQLMERLRDEFAARVNVEYTDNQRVRIDIDAGIVAGGKSRAFDSVVLDRIAAKLPPLDRLEPDNWARIVTPDLIDVILKNDVVELYSRAYKDSQRAGPPNDALHSGREPDDADSLARQNAQTGAFEHQLRAESSAAAAVLQLVRDKNHDVLTEMFFTTRDRADGATDLIRRVSANNGGDAFLSIETLDPRDREHLRSVALSPIAVVHLFRQYFFELDTFLGPPVGHVWLSPGSTVELIEVHTRRTLVERTLEESLDIITRSETSTTKQDEISEAVKEDNQRDVKFGTSVTASYASVQATASFDYGSSQKKARETTHKQMRQQTDKLSSEIRKNFKSTFRTQTETEDQSSSKYTLANTTKALINYEMRRKMRQVGVQVQDIGTFLCWQTYVDDPGSDLGLAELIHPAKSADLGGLVHPEMVPLLETFSDTRAVSIPFISIENTGADRKGEVYVDGVEMDDEEWWPLGTVEKIQADFEFNFVCPKPDHELSNVEFNVGGQPLLLSCKETFPTAGAFTIHLDSVDFGGEGAVSFEVILHWSPKAGANNAINAANSQNIKNFKEAERAAHEKAYVEMVKDRVTAASRIRRRNSEELREEERIVVYRKLVQDMLLSGVAMPDDRTRHVTAELLNAIFDVEKMLYFVAPEWWRPRLHRSRQQLLPTSKPEVKATDRGTVDPTLRYGFLRRKYAAARNTKASVLSGSTVGWGGVGAAQRDNYYITEDSEPAKLGSSLGWLMQLDGDNMRNAFLNAPWVKAVIPIRPGQEQAAINWLRGVEGMNGITDDVVYHAADPGEVDVDGDPLDGQKMIDVLMDLAEKVRRKYEEGIQTGPYPKLDEISDPALLDSENVVTATPVDRVYEHGFFPLEGSFRANVGKNYEIFDQWTEILPTDQVVPVEVTYDPKTGRQI